MSSLTKNRPRTKPPAARRDALVNAAQRLFLSQGVTPTTVEQITAGAQVAKGTFYLHFSSKDDLLAAMGERFAQQLLAAIETALDAVHPLDWPGKLATWAGASVMGYLDSVALHDVLFYQSRPVTRAGQADSIVVDHLARLLAEGDAAGAWRVRDPRLTAVFLFRGLHAVADDADLERHPAARMPVVAKLQEVCFSAVGLPQ